MGTIRIEGMQFYAFHGHFDAEQKVGNKFIVDIKIKTKTANAAKSDQLKDALNYQSVYDIIKMEMAIKSRLLENVADRILNALYSQFTSIKKCSVKISKINPPMGGEIEKVSVTLKR